MTINSYRFAVAPFGATLLAGLLSVGLVAPAAVDAEDSAPSYRVIDVGTVLGGPFAIVSGLGNKGVAGGYAVLPSSFDFGAFQWRDGVGTYLGTFGGPNSVLFGPASGWAESSELDPQGTDWCENGTFLICLPMVVKSGKEIPLRVLPGGYNAGARWDNRQGTVVGASENGVADPTCLVNGLQVPPLFQVQDFVPVIWENGRPRALPTYPGDRVGQAFAVNNLNRVVGYSSDCLDAVDQHALLWENSDDSKSKDHSKPRDLGTLGGVFSGADAINDLDEVTGFSDLFGDLTFHAFLWRDGVMKDLGTLPGDVASEALGINNKGQVVGYSFDVNFNERAFLWDHGTMTDLNTLIPAGSPLYLVLATSITDQGEITGFAYDATTGFNPAFLAVVRDDEGESVATAAALNAVVPRVATGVTIRQLPQWRLLGGPRAGRVPPQP